MHFSHHICGLEYWPGAKAIRAINNPTYDKHYKLYFKQNKILTLIDIYIDETIIHSTKTGKRKRSEIHNTKNSINLPYNRLKKSQNHPDYTGSKLFNSLPQDIKATQASNF